MLVYTKRWHREFVTVNIRPFPSLWFCLSWSLAWGVVSASVNGHALGEGLEFYPGSLPGSCVVTAQEKEEGFLQPPDLPQDGVWGAQLVLCPLTSTDL